jgi:restriction system protein
MPRRSSRRDSSEAGALGIALLAIGGITTIARWAEVLPRPWLMAMGVLALSAILLLAWSLVAFVRQRQRRHLLRRELLALSATGFEERVQRLLADLGWRNLQRRGGSGDRGVDLDGQLGGQRYIIQCKRYTKKVPPAMVRDLVGALHIQQADRAILVTTSGFTRQGYAEAQDQQVELWDGAALETQIARAAERRADPVRVRAAQRRRGAILSAGLLLNGVLIGWAFMTAGPLPLNALAAASRVSSEPTSAPLLTIPIPAAAPAAPAPAPAAPLPTAEPPPEAVPTAVATATVFNGGNVRAAPDLQGAVLDQVNAGEAVTLLGRSPDGVWLQISNVRGQIGWAHHTLLTLDSGVEQSLPILAPE